MSRHLMIKFPPFKSIRDQWGNIIHILVEFKQPITMTTDSLDNNLKWHFLTSLNKTRYLRDLIDIAIFTHLAVTTNEKKVMRCKKMKMVLKKLITSFLHNWVSIAESGRMKNYIASCHEGNGERQNAVREQWKVFITAKPHKKEEAGRLYMKWIWIGEISCRIIMQWSFMISFVLLFFCVAPGIKRCGVKKVVQ